MYVIPFPPAWPELDIDPADPKPIWRISNNGGEYPLWDDDGRELFYFTSTGSFISVATRLGGDDFQFDTGVELFNAPYEDGLPIDVLPGGQLFVLGGKRDNTSTRLQITLNWQRLLTGGASP